MSSEASSLTYNNIFTTEKFYLLEDEGDKVTEVDLDSLATLTQDVVL